jgi:hypothetical protein
MCVCFSFLFSFLLPLDFNEWCSYLLCWSRVCLGVW